MESIVKKVKLKMTEATNFPANTTEKKNRDPSKYIKAAKKNKWINHVKKCSSEKNVRYKEALALAKKSYRKK